MAYIANKPVRFDRAYGIGEVIPDAVIDPKMARRLADMGRILRVEIPRADEDAGEAAAKPQESAQSAEGTGTQAGGESRGSAAEGGGSAPKGGKESGSRKAASAHARVGQEDGHDVQL